MPVKSRQCRTTIPVFCIILAWSAFCATHGAAPERIKQYIDDIRQGPRVYLTPQAESHFARKQSDFDAYRATAVSADAAMRSLQALSSIGETGAGAWDAIDIIVEMFPQAVHVVTTHEVYIREQGTFEDWLMTKVMGEKNKFILTPPFLVYEAISKCRDFLDVSHDYQRAGDNVTLDIVFTFNAGACALSGISGRTFGTDLSLWRQWWAENRTRAPAPAPAPAAGAVPSSTPATAATAADIMAGGTYRVFLKTGDEFFGIIESADETSLIIETEDRGAFSFSKDLVHRHELISPPKKPDQAPVETGRVEILAFENLKQRPMAGKTLEIRIKGGTIFKGVFIDVSDDIVRLDIEGSRIPVAGNIIEQITALPSASETAALQPPPRPKEPAGPADTVIVYNPQTDDYGRRLPSQIYTGKITREQSDVIHLARNDGVQMTIKRAEIERVIKHTQDGYQKEIARYAKELFCPEGMVLVDIPPGKEGRPFFRVCMDRYEFPNVKGTVPRGNVSYKEAQEQCAALGKRLCTENEWQWTCSGLEAYTYPYGWNFDKTSCNTEGIERLKPAGKHDKCVSKFGAYDMVGNIFEWVTGNDGTPMLMGGPYSKCQAVSPGVGGAAKPQAGFRCCKSN